MESLYIYGASGHGKVIVEIAERLQYGIKGFVDDNPSIQSLLDYPVNAPFEFGENDQWIIAIGNNRIRQKVALQMDKKYASLIHPQTAISQRASVGKGTVIMAGVTVNSQASIGEHCIVNTNASIDHECFIGDYVHLSPNVALGGDVTVGEGTHIGIGACVIQGIKIGKWCTIGAGAVVIRDIPDGTTVVGNPARIIKQKEL